MASFLGEQGSASTLSGQVGLKTADHHRPPQTTADHRRRGWEAVKQRLLSLYE